MKPHQQRRRRANRRAVRDAGRGRRYNPRPDSSPPEWVAFSYAEAARAAGVPVRAIRSAVASGELRIGRWRLISLVELRCWLDTKAGIVAEDHDVRGRPVGRAAGDRQHRVA